MSRRWLGMGVAAVLLWASGCKDTTETPTEPPVAPPVEEPAPAPKLAPGVIRAGLTSLKESPDAKGKWLATLMRGEKVQVIEPGGEAHKVQLSDGSVGYLDAQAVLLGDIEEVLVLEDRPLYQRPDDAAPRDATVKLGTLLFILKTKDGWVEVQLPKGRTGWMKADDVARDAKELAVARNLYRHELLKDAKQKDRREQAAALLAETLASYPDSKVLAASGLAPGAAPATQPVEGAEGAEADADKPVEGTPAGDNINDLEPAEAAPAGAAPAGAAPAEAAPAAE